MVSDLCLGTMVFGEENSRGTDARAATRIIHKFLDAGGNHIDTANVYAGGRSEEIVGAAIKDRRDRAILATKVRHRTGENLNDQGLSRYHMIRSVEASLRRLQTDVIDLFIAHAWDPLTPLEETLRAFDDLVTSGKVRYIGVSNFKAWQLMKALALSDAHGWARFSAAQYQYSLVERNIEHEISELCLHEGLGLTPWGPLGGGFLSGKYQPGGKPRKGRLAMMPDETEEILAAAVKRTQLGNPSRLWRRSPERTKRRTPKSRWPGCSINLRSAQSSSERARWPQLDENLAAGELSLSEEELAHLEPDK